MTLDDEIRRGEQAKGLLEHPLMVEAFEKIEKEAVTVWQNTDAKDTQAREALYLSVKMLHKLRAQIQEVMETGEIARKQSLIQQAKEKMSSFLKAG